MLYKHIKTLNQEWMYVNSLYLETFPTTEPSVLL